MTPFEIHSIQPKAWEILSRSFENNRIGSTYLFHGPEGTGRWALAISLAALLNCEKPVKRESAILNPCGECVNCRKIFNLNHECLFFALPLAPHKNLEEAAEFTAKILEEKRAEPFKILSTAATANIPIDQAREIKRRLSMRGDAGITRVVIFYEMEKMKEQSADSLLKLIEEPPKDTVLILIVRRPEALLPTLQSRSQKIKVCRIPPGSGEKYLIEKHDLKEAQAKLLIRISDNSIGRAMALSSEDEDEGSSNRAVGFLLFKSLFDDPPYATIAHINDLVNARDRGGADELLKLWESLVRDCVNYSVLGEEDKLINLDFAGDIKRFSPRIAGGQAAEMTDDLKNTLEGLRRNVHIQGTVTALVLKLKSHIAVAGN